MDLFNDELSDEPLFESEAELKREIKRLERQIKKEQKWHDAEIDALRGQIRELLTKNMELNETNHLFAKGLDALKRDTLIITTPHHWIRRGVEGSLKNRITQLVMDGKRIVSTCPINISPQGDVMEVIIVTEHIDRTKIRHG